jgi:hypothetical protein
MTPQNSQNDPLSCPWDQEVDIHLDDEFLIPENPIASPPRQCPDGNGVPGPDAVPGSPHNLTRSRPKTEDLAEELRLLSLEAAAERYLGSSSGLSFAKLTQAVLRRLSPDQDAFVFDGDINGNHHNASISAESPTFNPTVFEFDTSMLSSLPLNSIFGNLAEDHHDSMDLALLEPSHIRYILEFYFAHSHTLYPIIRQNEFISVLWRVYGDPLDPLAQSPLWQFRIWMVLAIGSTTYCSVSLMDESESVQFFNKAMTYFEAAMGCGDLVSSLPSLSE